MLGVVVILWLVILVWAIYGLHVLELNQPVLEAISRPLADWLAEAGNPVRLGVWIGALLISIIAWFSSAESFLGKLQGEVTGMAITVIVIDELVSYRARLERKQEIFEQIESPVRDVAVEALRLARKYDWLGELVQKKKLLRGQFEGANLQMAYLEGASLVGTNLQGADLKGANLNGVDIAEANLKGANLEDVELQGAMLEEIEWQGANLMGAKLQRAYLAGVNLQGSDLRRANLQEARLIWVNLQEADLGETNLQGANLSNVNLEEANLVGANLEEVNLKEINLKGASYDALTVWPEGFDPRAAGAIEIRDVSLFS